MLLIAKSSKFGINFLSRIKTILKHQEYCIINGGKTTKYFKLQGGARQGDLICAYLVMPVLEKNFIFIKSNPNVKDLNIFKHKFSYKAYADDTTFFLKDKKYIIELMNVVSAKEDKT